MSENMTKTDRVVELLNDLGADGPGASNADIALEFVTRYGEQVSVDVIRKARKIVVEQRTFEQADADADVAEAVAGFEGDFETDPDFEVEDEDPNAGVSEILDSAAASSDAEADFEPVVVDDLAAAEAEAIADDEAEETDEPETEEAAPVWAFEEIEGESKEDRRKRYARQRQQFRYATDPGFKAARKASSKKSHAKKPADAAAE